MKARSTVLDGLDASDRQALMARSVPRRLRRGQTLYLAGEEARRVHLVTAGAIKLTARNSEGRDAILGLVLAGDMVGEVAVLDRRPQPLDAVATIRSEVVGIDADLLRIALSRNPDAALAMARMLAVKMRSIYASAAERTTGGVPARLAGRLLDLADALGQARGGVIELELPVAQEDLGRLAGMCRESTCKTLQTFKRAGLLDYRGRRVRLLRTDALERIRTAGRWRAQLFDAAGR